MRERKRQRKKKVESRSQGEAEGGKGEGESPGTLGTPRHGGKRGAPRGNIRRKMQNLGLGAERRDDELEET